MFFYIFYTKKIDPQHRAMNYLVYIQNITERIDKNTREIKANIMNTDLIKKEIELKESAVM